MRSSTQEVLSSGAKSGIALGAGAAPSALAAQRTRTAAVAKKEAALDIEPSINVAPAMFALTLLFCAAFDLSPTEPT